MIIRSIARKIKKISLYKMVYYSEPHNYGRTKIKVELDLSNYATKPKVKKATGVDTSDFRKKLI